MRGRRHFSPSTSPHRVLIPEGWRLCNSKNSVHRNRGRSATGGTHGIRDRQDRSVREWFEGVAGVEWHTRFFASREEFLAQPRSLLPGCLLPELQLPDGGLEPSQARRAARTAHHLHDGADEHSDDRARNESGAVDVLTKPFSGDTLSSVIRSALERSRSKLAHAETIESLDVVTASIAFDLKQSLCGIVTNANASPADACRRSSQVRVRARDRAAHDSRQQPCVGSSLQRFATLFGSEGATTESVNSNEATREVLTLLSSELKDTSVIVRIEFAQDLPLVASNRVQLQQAILNLARNALDARRTVNDRPGELLVRSELDGHDAVRLTFTDTGVGPGASFSFSLPSRFGAMSGKSRR